MKCVMRDAKRVRSAWSLYLRSMLSVSLLVHLLLLCSRKGADGANWAQTSGDFEQNVVFPRIPSPNYKHWQARFGHATVWVPAPPDPSSRVANDGKVFVLGGDSNDGDPTTRNLGPGAYDQSWNQGYKNDVWSMEGTEWMQGGDIRIRTKYRQKIPRTQSQMTYTQVTAGLHPSPGVTYDNWIVCAPYFNLQRYAAVRALYCDTSNALQWSPRRHHAALFFNGYIWVMGGRAREFVDLPEERSVGINSVKVHVKDAPRVGLARQIPFTTQREAVVLKSDVWRSLDGMNWELVTPGCKSSTFDQAAQGNPAVGRLGTKRQACSTSNDCYGAEVCTPYKGTKGDSFGVCLCDTSIIWSPREQLAAAVFNGQMFISGGYTSILYNQQTACGDFACGDLDASAYRGYQNDVWSSTDGEKWKQLTAAAWTVTELGHTYGLGRGGHQMFVLDPGIPTWSGDPANGGKSTPTPPSIWIIGGRGGDNLGVKSPNRNLYYYNDMWQSADGKYWTRFTGSGDPVAGNAWTPRCGHSAVLMLEAPKAGQVDVKLRTVYITGGQTYNVSGYAGPGASSVSSGPTPSPLSGLFVPLSILDAPESTEFLDETWGWRPDDYNDKWRQDFTPAAYFSTGDGSEFNYYNNSPAINYVHPDLDVSYMKRFVMPSKLEKHTTGKRLQQRPYLTGDWAAKLQMLYDVLGPGATIRNLATADLISILKLRGYDIPEVKHRYTFYDVCDARALAIAIVDKCSVHRDPGDLYDGERNQPWNIIPDFSLGLPNPDTNPVLWHGPDRKNYNFMTTPPTDVPTLLGKWNGCDYVPEIEGLFGPNIDGIGTVDQVSQIRDPLPELEELHCRWTPGPRAYHTALSYQERLYLFGGKQQETHFMGDTWYRDAGLPIVRFRTKPPGYTDYPFFYFAADEAGVSFEYRVWDPINYIELRPWTSCVSKTDIGWLSWRKKGPGNGWYTLEVRTVDAAGNRDEKFYFGRNVWTWYYVSPTPWDIIFEGVGSFTGLAIFGYLEYRRRVRKAAMERYAMKRMRRKFKAMQRDIDGRAVDWRTLYMESKAQEEANKGKKKAKKAVRDKKAEQREKDKKKREKEKEKIKKKLKAESKNKEKEMRTQAVMNKGAGADSEGDADKSKKPKKDQKRFAKGGAKKDGESGGESGGDEKKKMKEYEVKGKGGGGGKAKKEEPSKEDKAAAEAEGGEGAKQRKVNKRYKEYEAGESGEEETKKDA